MPVIKGYQGEGLTLPVPSKLQIPGHTVGPVWLGGVAPLEGSRQT